MKGQRGFTLLEVLVASLIMGIAVTGLLSALSSSLRNASKLTDYDRGVLLARQKLDELILSTSVQPMIAVEGVWDPKLVGGLEAGWRGLITPFEKPPGAPAGMYAMERVQVEVWWMDGGHRKTFALEGYRRARLTAEEAALP